MTKKFLCFHLVGLSCLIGAAILNLMMFCFIVYQGYFYAIEPRIPVLYLEAILAVFGVIYVFHLFRKLMVREKI